MPEKEPKTIRLPKPDADRVREYADEAELTEADAFRRLIRVGLDEDDPTAAREGPDATASMGINTTARRVAAAAVALLLVGTVAFQVSPTATYAGAGGFLGAVAGVLSVS